VNVIYTHPHYTIKYIDVQDNEGDGCSLLGCNIIESGRWLPVFWNTYCLLF